MIDKITNEVIIKIVNAGGVQQTKTIRLKGLKKIPSTGLLTVLQGNDLTTVNSFDNPQNISPIESVLPLKGKQFDFMAPPYSFSVIRVKM